MMSIKLPQKEYRKIILAIVFLMIAIIMFFCTCIHKSEIYTNNFSYVNDYNINDNYYCVSGDAPWIGIVFDTPVRCDMVKLFFAEEHLDDISAKVYYSTGNGLSEESVMWTTLRQGSTETKVDLPNKVYSELRIDIHGNFVLDHIEIEQYGKYDVVLKILIILFGITGVFLLLSKTIKNDNGKHWLRENFKAILVFAILEIIMISYSVNVWWAVSDKTTSSYHLETSYNTEIIEADGNEHFYNIDISDNKLFQLDFTADLLAGSGEAKWKLYEEENCVLMGNLQSDSFVQGVCAIKLDKSMPYSGAAYQISIEPINGTSLQIYIDDNNYLNATYYYLFTYGNILRVFVIIINIVISILLILLVSKINIYVKFWIIAVSMGLLSIVIVIPCSTADEFRHFARAYSLANGEFATNYDDEGNAYTEMSENLYNYRYMAPGNSISIADETNFALNLSRWIYYLQLEETEETVHAMLIGVSEKGILEYLPQVIAIWIGKFLKIKPVWFFYLARIGNWLAVAMIWFVAIRLLPRHKMLFIVLYSMPTNIVYSCTSSNDGLLNAFIMLILSIAIKAYYDEIELTNIRVIMPVLLISIYIAIIKLPYVIIVYVLIALSSNIQNIKDNWKKILRGVAIITVLCIVCYLVQSFSLRITRLNLITNSSGGGSNGNDHIAYALEHLLKVSQVFLQTFINRFYGLYHDALAVNSLSVDIVVIPYSILMVYAASIEREKKEINVLQTIILSFICLVMWGSVILVAYFWSGIGATDLWGIQGRYMCPVIMIAAIIFAMRKEERKRIAEERYIPAMCLGILCVGFICIFQLQWL